MDKLLTKVLLVCVNIFILLSKSNIYQMCGFVFDEIALPEELDYTEPPK